jgi:hypothetical protein
VKKYRLLHISGGVEPNLILGTYYNWDLLEEGVSDFIQSGQYNSETDGLFWIELGRGDKLLNISSFSVHLMEQIEARSGV